MAMRMLRYGPWVLERHRAALLEADLLDDERVLWIYNHITFARRLWLQRVRDGRIRTSPRDVVPVAEAIERCVDDTAAWVAWLDSLAEDELSIPVSFTSLEGEDLTMSLADIVMHVINHSTHHAHELATIVRAHGHVPPSTDFIVFARQHP